MSFGATLLLFFVSLSEAQQIALTFDDAPNAATSLSGSERACRLVEALKRAKIPEVSFFCNSIKLDEEGKQRLALYAQSGHLIGNHTHSHPEFNTTELDLYIQDMVTADSILHQLPGFVKWFRFPYLREGDTFEKRNRARAELKKLGYFNAYITVNSYDWAMDVLFQRAKLANQQVNLDALRETYVQVLIESVLYYDKMASDVLGRSPKHVLLLHENDLAALYVDDLAKALRSRGWEIISPSLAYQDELAWYVTPTLFPRNPGRVGEIAQDKNWSGRLWHHACDEQFLEDLFITNGVYGRPRQFDTTGSSP